MSSLESRCFSTQSLLQNWRWDHKYIFARESNVKGGLLLSYNTRRSLFSNLWIMKLRRLCPWTQNLRRWHILSNRLSLSGQLTSLSRNLAHSSAQLWLFFFSKTFKIFRKDFWRKLSAKYLLIPAVITSLVCTKGAYDYCQAMTASISRQLSLHQVGEANSLFERKSKYNWNPPTLSD